MTTALSLAVWATPLAWTFLALLMVRLGYVDARHLVPAVALVLVGVGGVRALACSRGGLAGRAAELVLVGSAVAWLLARPAAHQQVVALTGAALATGLTLLGVWPSSGIRQQRRLAAVAGAAAGVVVATAGPGSLVTTVLVIAAAAGTGRLLAATVPPHLAAVATLAVAAAMTACSPITWTLPPLVAAAMWCLRGRPWITACLAVPAAAVTPAGLAVSLGLLTAAARRSRSPRPLLLLAPVLLTAWWRLPQGASPATLIAAPSLDAVLATLPLSFAALPLLLPLVVLGLASRSSSDPEARDLLGAGLLVLPFIAVEPAGLQPVITSLWLAVLPAAAAAGPRLQWAVATSLPWSIAAASVMLLLAPAGGAGIVPVKPLLLTGGWLLALVVSVLARHRIARMAWLLPAAGLLWTVPVEGGDRRLAAGETLELPAPSGVGWVMLVSLDDEAGIAPGDPVLEAAVGAMVPRYAGIDCPLGSHGTRHPLVYTNGQVRGFSQAAALTPVVLVAKVPLRIRVERAERWMSRHRRMTLLLGGALLLLAAAHLPRRKQVSGPGPLGVSTCLLLAGVLAAGCSVVLLARPAMRDAPDIAAAVLLGCWLALLPALRSRRLLAGALLLVPLALAQPVMRGPAGDEVYHMLLLESIWQDHDLAISNNIDPDNRGEAIYLRNHDRLIHSPLLALLALPGYLLLGHTGVLVMTALMVAGGAALVAGRCRQLGFTRRQSDGAWVATLLSYPALTFATQLWPGSVAGLLVGVLLIVAAREGPEATWLDRAGAVLAVFVAVVVKVRLALVVLPVALAGQLRRPSLRQLLVTVAAVATAALSVALLLGGPLGRHQLWELRPGSLVGPITGLWGLLWDGAGGLAFAAPLWLVGLAMLPAVWRRGRAGERGLLVGAVLTMLALAPRGEWYGGGSPPARYLVPLLPLAQLALASALACTRGRRLLRLALPWAAVAAWMAVTRPLQLFNSGDAGWWLPDVIARSYGMAIHRCLPSLLRPGWAALIVPAVLVAAALWWQLRQRRAAAAVTIVGLGLVVGIAATWRESRIDAEDPQVIHLAGQVEPPRGTFFRARSELSWRLPDGGALEVPWNPPLDRSLQARVRIDGDKDSAGHLLATWSDGSFRRCPVRGRHWQLAWLPRPAAYGRSTLRLQWFAGDDQSQPAEELLVDRVEVAP